MIFKLLNATSCKQISRLLSDKQDRPLTLGEKIRTSLHLKICKPCCNYQSQVEFLDRATSLANDKRDENSEHCLDENARERIRQLLRQKQSH